MFDLLCVRAVECCWRMRLCRLTHVATLLAACSLRRFVDPWRSSVVELLCNFVLCREPRLDRPGRYEAVSGRIVFLIIRLRLWRYRYSSLTLTTNTTSTY